MRRPNIPRKLTLRQQIDFQWEELRLEIVNFWAMVLRKLDDGCGFLASVYALSTLLTFGACVCLLRLSVGTSLAIGIGLLPAFVVIGLTCIVAFFFAAIAAFTAKNYLRKFLLRWKFRAEIRRENRSATRNLRKSPDN